MSNGEPDTKVRQLFAACSVSGYVASRVLGVRQFGNLNEVPDEKDFQGIFDFSKADLLEYIKSNPGLAEALLGKSYDNRDVPAAFMEEGPDGYRVGWFDGSDKELRIHSSIEVAAADFVLRFWGMPRD